MKGKTAYKSASALVRDYKRQTYQDEDGTVRASAKEMADTHGHRIRQTKASRVFGPDVWEVSTSYFYRNQATTLSLIDRLQQWAEPAGFSVEIVDRPGAAVRFDQRQWPVDSWAIAYVRIAPVTDQEVAE